MDFTPDGKSLLVGASDGNLYAFDLVAGNQPRRVSIISSSAGTLAVSPDGKTAAVAVGPGIRLIDLATGKNLVPDVGHSDWVYEAAVTPDGRTAVTSSDSDLYLWDASSGRLRNRLQGHRAHINSHINGLKLIDDGRKVITSTFQDGTLRIWDLVAEKEVGRIESADERNILQAVSSDGKTIAVSGSDSLTVLFDVGTGKEIQRLKGPGLFGPCGAAFLPDGRTLVVWYTEDNMVYHWDLASGKKVFEYSFLDYEDPPGRNRIAAPGQSYTAAV